MKINFKRVISTFLATSMLLSTMSTAFADGTGINTASPGTSGSVTGTGDDRYHFSTSQRAGYRVSVYFTPVNGYNADGTYIYDWDKTFKIGETLDIYNASINTSVNYYTTNTIFDYVRAGKITTGLEIQSAAISGNYSYVLWDNNWASAANANELAEDKIWPVWDEVYDALGTDDASGWARSKLDDYRDARMTFTSSTIAIKPWETGSSSSFTYLQGYWTDESYIREYFSHPAVLNQISYLSNLKAGTPSWSLTDYLYGRYTDELGNTQNGEYKIYIEPISAGRQATSATSYEEVVPMTYYDSLVRVLTNSSSTSFNLIGSTSNRATHLATALALGKTDYSLKYSENAVNTYTGLTSNYTDGTMIMGTIDVSGLSFNTIQRVYDTQNDPNYVKSLNALGVSVLTSPSIGIYDFESTPNVITTYVMVKSIDASGNVTYAEIDGMDTELDVEPVFIEDSLGNVSNYVQIPGDKDTSMGPAYLIDIQTVPELYAPDTTKTEWVNTDIIVRYNDEIK